MMLADKVSVMRDQMADIVKRLNRMDEALLDVSQQLEEYKRINEQQHALLRELFHGEMRPDGERKIRALQQERNRENMRRLQA